MEGFTCPGGWLYKARMHRLAMHVTPSSCQNGPRVEFGAREWYGLVTTLVAAIAVPLLAVFGWAWQLNSRIAVLENVIVRQTAILERHDQQVIASLMGVQRLDDVQRRLDRMEHNADGAHIDRKAAGAHEVAK